jgi:hypothetical protein
MADENRRPLDRWLRRETFLTRSARGRMQKKAPRIWGAARGEVGGASRGATQRCDSAMPSFIPPLKGNKSCPSQRGERAARTRVPTRPASPVGATRRRLAPAKEAAPAFRGQSSVISRQRPRQARRGCRVRRRTQAERRFCLVWLWTAPTGRLETPMSTQARRAYRSDTLRAYGITEKEVKIPRGDRRNWTPKQRLRISYNNA